MICAPVRHARQDMRVRDGFIIVTLFWSALGLAGALPFWLAESMPVSFIDAFFESLSGLTTTGTTVLVGLDDMPRSILYYRQQLQWLGGMGIIVLAVAILPMLGIGGMQLYRAEAPGPVKDQKLTPCITETAKALGFIYLTLTVACAICYALAGMSVFDAVAHAFSTVAIGGFSTYDASIGHFSGRVRVHAAATHGDGPGSGDGFSAVAACINNLGPGLGAVGANFVALNAPAKGVLCFAMILGRLDIFTVLVLLTPAFGRR